MSVTKGSPGRATVRNQAGSSTRKMQMSRLAAGVSVILAVLLITFVYSQNSTTIAKTYGIGATIVVFLSFLAALKYLDKYGEIKAKRFHDARRGAEAEEAAVEILDSLPGFRKAFADCCLTPVIPTSWVSAYRMGATVAVAAKREKMGRPGRVSGGSFSATDGNLPSASAKYPPDIHGARQWRD